VAQEIRVAELLSAAFLLAAGEAERALPHLERAERLAPGPASALRLGIARDRLDDHAGAERDLRRALDLRPSSGEARIALGSLLRRRGDALVERAVPVMGGREIAPQRLVRGTQLAGVRARRKADLPAVPPAIIALRVAVLAVAASAVVYAANQDLGVPYVGLVIVALLLFWTYVLNRTRFGRHVYAVGGNAEAARRAGINVDAIRIACFAICSFMAALGGIILASRLSSVDTAQGGGSILLYSIAAAVIGGTSLFGGRGDVRSALLGALVIASIDNGLGLVNVSSGTQFVVTGVVLLAAVTVDSIARRGREKSGRA